MINERQYIKESIYDWVAAVVSETGRTDPVIYDNDSGPRPLPPFISLEFTASATPGSPDYSMVTPDEGNGEQSISQFVQKSMSMYAWGEGAIDLLETIKASTYREQYIEMLAKKYLVIPQVFEVRENPVARGNEIENGALFEFYLTYIRVITDSPGWIDKVKIADPELGILITNVEES